MLIDGKKIASDIEAEIAQKITNLHGRLPCLTMIMIGDNPASHTYVSRKAAACQRIGITSQVVFLSVDISENELISTIHLLNNDQNVDGILIQLPLPSHVNFFNIISALSPEKDVDGLHPFNAGKMMMGYQDAFIPCTPLGIKELLIRSQIETKGKHVVILGRSAIVGKPLALLLGQNGPGGNATVTLAHSHTQHLKELCLLADILVVAIGSPHFLSADMVRKGAVVIDVGINRVLDISTPRGYRIVGDVDFDKVKEHCSWITPVPNGVGPMTIAMLLQNTLKSYLNHACI